MTATTRTQREAGPRPDAGVRRQAILARGHAVLEAEARGLDAAAARLGPAFVDSVEAVLAGSGRVCVTGIGKARLIAEKLAATFASSGTLSYGLHPVEALHGDLGMVHADDVVIGLSKSGGSELASLLPLLKARGCRIILITASPESPAARHADHVLDIGDAPEACPLGLAPSTSTTAMLAVGDALALTVMEMREVRPEDYARVHPGGALGRSLARAHEIMRAGDEVPTVHRSSTLGECYAALLHAPQRAGAAVVVDDKRRLVGIVTHGDFFRLFESRGGTLELPVTEVMSGHPLRVHRDALVMQALEQIRLHSVDELPVVDDEDRVVGLIDIQDLIARGYTVFDTP